MSSKQAPRTQKYLRACAEFVDAIQNWSTPNCDETGTSIMDFTEELHDGGFVLDRGELARFLAKAQEQS